MSMLSGFETFTIKKLLYIGINKNNYKIELLN